MSVRSSLFAIGLLTSATAQAKEVKILCDVSKTDENGQVQSATRQYVLNDETKAILFLGPDGNKSALCEVDKCVLAYTTSSITYTRYVGKVRDERNVVRFSLNRLSGRLIENWDIAAFRIHDSFSGTCQAVAEARRKF